MCVCVCQFGAHANLCRATQTFLSSTLLLAAPIEGSLTCLTRLFVVWRKRAKSIRIPRTNTTTIRLLVLLVLLVCVCACEPTKLQAERANKAARKVLVKKELKGLRVEFV